MNESLELMAEPELEFVEVPTRTPIYADLAEIELRVLACLGLAGQPVNLDLIIDHAGAHIPNPTPCLVGHIRDRWL